MSSDNADISVEITCDIAELKMDGERLKSLARSVCRRFGLKKARVGIAIVDDEAIRKVNSSFLDKPEETDVISFDLSDDSDAARCLELVVNADEAARQGKARGHPPEAELALYITHGLLHNLGFDDATTEAGAEMHRTEDEILTEAGFGRVFDKQPSSQGT